MRVRRTHLANPDDLDGCRYAVTTRDGREFEVSKVFYAHGPSLFTWVLTGCDESREFATKRAALRYVESLTPTS
jgi:hypothetical protein